MRKNFFTSSKQRKAILKGVGYALLVAILSSLGIHVSRYETEAMSQGSLPFTLETAGKTAS